MKLGPQEPAPSPNGLERLPNPVCYRCSVEHVTRLLMDHPASSDRVVAACPDWTVRDLVAHLAEVCTRALGHTPGAGPALEKPPARADIPELLTYWNGITDELERRVAGGAGKMSDRLVADAFVHEGDIRAILGKQMPAGHPSHACAMEFGVNGFSHSLTIHGLPALRIEAGDLRWIAGEGEPAAAVSGDLYDLVRSLAGRRSHEQIARLAWSKDPTSWMPAFSWGPFVPPAQAIEAMAAYS